MATRKSRKKQRLRNNEYYDTQAIYDELYSKAKENRRFTNLYDLIVSRENILLAYRNIKKNKGSKTKGQCYYDSGYWKRQSGEVNLICAK